jgi:diaminopimelate epimerase
MEFTKYHALGNDYLILAPPAPFLDAPLVTRLCDRHRGVGSDGILVGPVILGEDIQHRPVFGLRIFNPDGSEAELSGNGLRLMARRTRDLGLVGDSQPFVLRTLAGDTIAAVTPGGRTVRLELAPASHLSTLVPMTGPPREVIDETLLVGDEPLRITAVNVGNPHCVIVRQHVSATEIRRLGPLVETHPAFPRRTNVQLLAVRDRHQIELETWERGAGYTLASGSSSLAGAAAARRLGLVDGPVRVHMPGGTVEVDFASDGGLRLSGGVTRVAAGSLDPELWADLPNTTAGS